MKLQVPSELVKALKKRCKNNPMIEEMHEWGSSNIDTRFLSEKEFKILCDLADERKDKDRDTRRFVTRLNHIKTSSKAKTKRLKTLEPLTAALTDRVSELPGKIVYLNGLNMTMMPYYVAEIELKPYNHHSQDPAHIVAKLFYFSRGKTGSEQINVYKSNLGKVGVTVDELMTEVMELIPERPALNKEHAEQVELYKQYRTTLGKQYLGHHELKRTEGGWRSSPTIDAGSEGARLVMEDDVDMGDGGPMITNDFWIGEHTDDEENVTLPIHPVMRLFSLSSHEFVTAHVEQLEPYKYDERLGEKLVLDQSKKKMIDLLVNAEHEEGGDIIKGKSGGIIILSSGAPGTGKTLTAEVYAEVTKKALYVVQCSQLGTDPEELEEKLQIVLARATRWGVVLLIDEADVYIHERGSDLEQNAIVGVFLRLLEYYKGILFLTTNRETVVDDAIISRITAHVRYKIPEKDQQKEIWRIMATQYKLKLTDKDITGLLKEFPGISGRTIKQLVRLVKVMTLKDRKTSKMDMFIEAAVYQTVALAPEVVK